MNMRIIFGRLGGDLDRQRDLNDRESDQLATALLRVDHGGTVEARPEPERPPPRQQSYRRGGPTSDFAKEDYILKRNSEEATDRAAHQGWGERAEQDEGEG
jgi:hypothetical protein